MAAPTNGTCARAIDVTSLLPYSVVVDTTLAVSDTSVHPTCDVGGGAKAVWWLIENRGLTYEFVTFDTTGSNYFQDLSVWKGGCGSLTQVECQNIQYFGHNYLLTFAAAPGVTYWVLIVDNGAGTGGSLHLAVDATTLAAGSVITVTAAVSSPYKAFSEAFDATGALVARDTSYTSIISGSSGINDIDSMTVRPSTGELISSIRGGAVRSSSIWTASPVMGALSRSIIADPDIVPTLGWSIVSLNYDAAGRLYVLWRGAQSGNGAHCLQRRQDLTYVVINEWKAFEGAATGNIKGGAVSPDGTKFYYWWAQGGPTAANVIRVLDLGTGVPSTFATYSTFNTGTATGYFFFASFRTDSDGNVYAIAQHETSSTPDGAHLLKYSSAAAVIHDYTMTVGPTVSAGFGLNAAATFAWTIQPDIPGGTLRKYLMSDGSITVTSTDPAGFTFGDVIVIEGSPDPPPPPPATVTYPTARERVFVLPFETNLMLFLNRIEFLVQAGEGLVTGQGSDPTMEVRFSRDGGKTYGNAFLVKPGKIGEYDTRSYINRLGRGRNFVCKLRVSDPVFWALLDCYADMEEGTS